MPEPDFIQDTHVDQKSRAAARLPVWAYVLIFVMCLAVGVALGGASFYFKKEVNQEAEIRDAILRGKAPPKTMVPSYAPFNAEEEVRKGSQAYIAKDCKEAILHFTNAVVSGVLSREQEENTWFAKGICESELRQRDAAYLSFLRVKDINVANTSVDLYLSMTRPLAAQ